LSIYFISSSFFIIIKETILAPSNSLRKWFGHDEKKGDEFKRRYFIELNEKRELIDIILNKASQGPITLLYGAKNEKFNNAVALKEYLEDKMKTLL
jgi:uncharacterized protein YeaO (DUF488 family)